MEDGIPEILEYLGDWFIRKSSWASTYAIKENASSIKKFNQCMSEKGHIPEKDYKLLCEIKK